MDPKFENPPKGEKISASTASHSRADGAPAPSASPNQRAFLGRKKALIFGVLALAAIAIGFGVWRHFESSKQDANRLVLYGNVDLRQVELAFNNNSERIAEVLVQEGDKVTRGQILSRLDTGRLRPQAATAEAEMEAQQAVVQKLRHGSRPVPQSVARISRRPS